MSNKRSSSEITVERLREVLNYNPDTGDFTWRAQMSYRIKPGDKAGCSAGPGGRPIIVIDRANHYAIRLAWLYMKGEQPTGKLVFKDGDKTNLKWNNIVQKTQSEVIASSGINSANTSGIKGVSWSRARGRWTATITRNGRQHFLGAFIDKEDAAKAYQEAAETGELPGDGSARIADWKNARRTRSAPWSEIKKNPSIVGWDNLDQLIKDIGEPPTPDHQLMRIRYGEPLGPNNAMWRLPWRKRPGHDVNNPSRSYNVGVFFDLTADQTARMAKEQDNKCAICKRPERATFNGKIKELAIDHHHEENYVRGLLCSSCNNGIGRFDDNPEWLRAAADYIEFHKKKNKKE